MSPRNLYTTPFLSDPSQLTLVQLIKHENTQTVCKRKKEEEEKEREPWHIFRVSLVVAGLQTECEFWNRRRTAREAKEMDSHVDSLTLLNLVTLDSCNSYWHAPQTRWLWQLFLTHIGLPHLQRCVQHFNIHTVHINCSLDTSTRFKVNTVHPNSHLGKETDYDKIFLKSPT
jgi:hypothetical protein